MPENNIAPEEVLNVNRKWLPPEPHLSKVIEAVQKGSAHIENRGHGEAPLLVFEDGGVIELPKARYENTYRGMQLVSAPEATQMGQTTKHRDVCGCVDEMKGILRDNPDSLIGDPHKFDQLLDDALYMISRMSKREDEYRKFITDVVSACMNIPHAPDPKMASSAAEEIKNILYNHPEDGRKYADLLNQLAEDVRWVASNQERVLREYKHIALKIFALYKSVKGARNWDKEEAEC
ncbi:MAG: hypothetical protein K6T99_09080 [Armatimonadetes bacterium]|nr:hypothetical protein [Armatimonadota bacterium]